jgi:formylglycine-generating enzyme required for sulfatase activity
MADEAAQAMVVGDLGPARQLYREIKKRDPMYPRIDALVHQVDQELTRPYVRSDLQIDKVLVAGRDIILRGPRSCSIMLLWPVVTLVVAILIVIVVLVRMALLRTAAPEPCTTRVRETDRAVMMYLPTGKFQMGSTEKELDALLEMCPGCDRALFENQVPQHVIHVAAFWMDRTEVTNAQYGQCVAAGECSPPQKASSNTRALYYGVLEYDDYPVVYVTWQQARDYAEWAGGRLCTEAEWEYAARGPEASTYPWGESPPDDTLLNYSNNEGDTTRVGSYPRGKSWCGALDMSGNVWEWTQSLSVDYPYVPDDGREDLEADGERVVRGGAYDNAAMNVRCAVRGKNGLTHSSQLDGFRVCASAPPDEAPLR